jgi:hypothetical protein
VKKHELLEYESDFFYPGYKAVCSCSWKSDRVPSMESALCEHQIHVRERVKEESIESARAAQGEKR